MNHILFPITWTCNLSCKFCVAKDNKEVIDIDDSLLALKSKVGVVEWVYITGGEPFLIETLPDVCDKIRSMGFKVGVTTNGTHFRPEIADHADRIGISLDGDKEYHDAYRGTGVFDKAVGLFNAIKGRCETVVMSVAFKSNEEALKKLKPVVEEMDPTYWQIQRDMYDPSVIVPSF